MLCCNFFDTFASKEMINNHLRSQDVFMKINESSVDSVIRIFAAVLLLYLGLGGELAGVLAIVAVIAGVILLLTGVVGFCPLYAIFRRKK